MVKEIGGGLSQIAGRREIKNIFAFAESAAEIETCFTLFEARCIEFASGRAGRNA